jgi:hypothetical protein
MRVFFVWVQGLVELICASTGCVVARWQPDPDSLRLFVPTCEESNIARSGAGVHHRIRGQQAPCAIRIYRHSGRACNRYRGLLHRHSATRRRYKVAYLADNTDVAPPPIDTPVTDTSAWY